MMKKLIRNGLFAFLVFIPFSVFSAPIEISPGVQLFLKNESWATTATLPVVARSAGRLIPYIGTAITFGPSLYSGIEAMLGSSTFRQSIGDVKSSVWDPLAPPKPADLPAGFSYYPTVFPTQVAPTSSAASACQSTLDYMDSMNRQSYSCAISEMTSATETTCYFKQDAHNNMDYCTLVGNSIVSTPLSKFNSCPENFMLSGLTCTYQYPVPVTRGYIPDQYCDGPYADTDLDCAVYRPKGKQTLYGYDSEGPFVVELDPGTNGSGSTIRRRVQTRNMDTNESQIETDTLNFDKDGKLQSGSHTNEPGTITLPTATPNPIPGQPPIIPEPIVTPKTPQNPVVFPDDYAREDTLKLTNTALKKLTETMHQDLTDIKGAVNSLKDAPDILANPDINNPQKHSFDLIKNNGMFDLLRGQSFVNVGECPKGSFSWNGNVYYFDKHCQLIEDSFGIFQPVMISVYLILAVFIVLRA